MTRVAWMGLLKRPVNLGWMTVVSLLVLLATATACVSNPGQQEVVGRLISVTTDDLIEWQSIKLLTKEGRELTFKKGEGIDLRFWRASHLREHLASGESIRISYQDTGDGLVALSVSDWP